MKMKIETTRQFILNETEAQALHDLIAGLSLNGHQKLLANSSLGKPLYNGLIEDAYYVLVGMYKSLHKELTIQIE